MNANQQPLTFNKPPIILDMGESLVKIGYGGESRPRYILPTTLLFKTSIISLSSSKIDSNSVKVYNKKIMSSNIPPINKRDSSNIRQFSQASSKYIKSILPKENELKYILSDVYKTIFDKYLLIQSTERDVFIGENTLTTIAFKQATVHILFNILQVPSVSFIPLMVMPIYLTGLSTGLVIDFGYTDVRIMPTYNGVPLTYQYRDIPIGSKIINIKLQRMLFEAQNDNENARIIDSLTEQQIEDIKIKIGIVMFNIDKISLETITSQEIKINNNLIKIPSECRWKIFECLFGYDESYPYSICTAFTECIEACSLDLRMELLQNIILCGGLTETPGFHTRFATEISNTILSNNNLAPLYQYTKIYDSPFRPLYLQWIGSAIHGLIVDKKDYVLEDFKSGEILIN